MNRFAKVNSSLRETRCCGETSSIHSASKDPPPSLTLGILLEHCYHNLRHETDPVVLELGSCCRQHPSALPTRGSEGPADSSLELGPESRIQVLSR